MTTRAHGRYRSTTLRGSDDDVAVNFVLMLTEKDVTIPDALEVYEKLAVDSLRNIAFKDVGADRQMVQDLTDAAHADGRSVLLELADMSDRGQEQGLQLGVDLGVDQVVARWRADFADALATEGAPEYWPFLGSLSGSPLVLDSTPDELAAQADELSRAGGVGGFVLMPYRQSAYDAVALLERASAAATVPVLVAGGVRDAEQIDDIAGAGGWGFTMGGAALAERHGDPESVSRRVADIMRLCEEVPARRSGSPRTEEKVK
ncbi:hypothetical protein [Streptomyces sp. NPDC056452]|uniref:hypothetical protein n=1 Tax=Streptomyces sp. NPDC056452 TaxID=3345821 RepID=UPI0036B9D5D3